MAFSDIIPCASGYHLLKQEHISYWIMCGAALFIAENKADTQLIYDKIKIVVGQARLISCIGVITPHIAVSFIEGCANHVAHLKNRAAADAAHAANAAARVVDAANAATAVYAVDAIRAAHAADPVHAADAAVQERFWQGGLLIKLLQQNNEREQ